MENSYLISVIIPAYNAAPYLAQCLENILNQTDKNIEIIVVDDGSTDNTAKIAEEYQVKLIRKENEGVSKARNVGLKAATGDFIHFMDADDLINLDFYQQMLTAAVSYDADVAYCGMINEREPKSSNYIDYKFLAIVNEDKFALTKVASQGYCFKYLFKASFLSKQKLEFDETAHIAEDMIFSIQAVFLANKVVSAPGAVYYYKYRQDSALVTQRKKSKWEREKTMKPLRLFKRNFEKMHNIKLNNLGVRWTRYRFLGMLLLKKKTDDKGNAAWYFLGLCIIQRKDK